MLPLETDCHRAALKSGAKQRFLWELKRGRPDPGWWGKGTGQTAVGEGHGADGPRAVGGGHGADGVCDAPLCGTVPSAHAALTCDEPVSKRQDPAAMVKTAPWPP